MFRLLNYKQFLFTEIRLHASGRQAHTKELKNPNDSSINSSEHELFISALPMEERSVKLISESLFFLSCFINPINCFADCFTGFGLKTDLMKDVISFNSSDFNPETFLDIYDSHIIPMAIASPWSSGFFVFSEADSTACPTVCPKFKALRNPFS